MSARGTTARRAPARPAPRPARPAARPRALPGSRARRAAPSLRARHVVVPLVALLLGGIVWINVARLNLATETSGVVERSRDVQFETARLQAQLDQRNGAVVDRARRDLGMVPSPSEGVSYIDIPPDRSVR